MYHVYRNKHTSKAFTQFWRYSSFFNEPYNEEIHCICQADFLHPYTNLPSQNISD